MKYLFDIDGIAYELELSKDETKRLEYKKGRFVNVSVNKIGTPPTKETIGNGFLRIEFDNGRVWKHKDAVIAKEKRGGYRPNSGRKKTTERDVPIMVRVTKEAAEKLKRLTGNRSEYIDKLIMQQPE